ncbi:hypothetical protein TRICI_005084 [Trichomonascus ciferrii]|uniref:P-type Na(+) transporter n=1 Tax=Trichomonascus ciferrii TaxID=44093 RepID=A0A642UW22_9ASCO|nr:hypothetical protein TRICI_005084 [Trichomonascus ciferrii]
MNSEKKTHTWKSTSTDSTSVHRQGDVENYDMNTVQPWTLAPHRVVEIFNSDGEAGLSPNEAKNRLQQFGNNSIEDDSGVSIMQVFIRQVCNAMIMVLLICMAISFGIKDWISGGFLGFTFLLNVVVGFIQEFNAEKTMDALRSLSSPTAKVLRNGSDETIPTAELVPGDLVVINVGDTVPADCRVLKCTNLETDEALLTGESIPIAKEADAVIEAESAVGDRINMIFSSSIVTKGRAEALVTSTGMNTEIGTIAASLRGKNGKIRHVEKDEDGNARKRDYVKAFLGTCKDIIGAFLGTNTGTPLHRLLAKLSILLFFVAVLLAIIAMAAQKFNVNREVAVYAIVAAVAMIPACLVLVLTVTMAIGTKAMVARNVIVRRLDSLEALGAVNDICSDKTGTLTQGKMVLKKVWLPGGGTYEVSNTSEPFNPTIGSISYIGADGDEEPKVISDVPDNQIFVDWIDTASLANIANVRHVYDKETGESNWKANGDPTEIAVQVFVSRLNWQRERWLEGAEQKFSSIVEYPFDSSVKRMTTVYKNLETGKVECFAKGAVERLVGTCDYWHNESGEKVKFTSEDHKYIFEKVDSLAEQGLRVLAFAKKTLDDDKTDWNNTEREDVEHSLTFLGLVGIYDPPREESAPSVKMCHRAGINVHMLTGDHPATAKAIALEVGILPKDFRHIAEDVRKAMVMTAHEFDALSDDEIDKLPVLPLVVARCAPQTKVRMIEALHRRKAFTAMTGDGVNDSPSLKQADVGIAMGIAGSDVAKDASDIVLSDDNFASILNAVEEGRRMADNIQKFALHLLAGNIAQASFLMIGLAFKDIDDYSVFPLSPVEVLWIIMVTASFPAIGLGVEQAEAGIMEKKPKDPKSAVFTWEVITDMFVYGLILCAVSLCSFVGIVYGEGKGELGQGCNNSYSEDCRFVYRGRSTAFVILTWGMLFLAWEIVDMRRSMFVMQPDTKTPYTQFFRDVWRNQILFWSVMIGIVTVFPLVYIPVINRDVFRHSPISWEWAVSVAGLVIFVAGAELWKWLKRAYFRRYSSSYQVKNPEEDLAPFARYNTIGSNAVSV